MTTRARVAGENHHEFTNRKIMTHTKSKKNPAGAKAEIRVIKKAEIGRTEKAIAGVNDQRQKEGEPGLVVTVMNWISDLETRKLEEARLAMERFQHL